MDIPKAVYALVSVFAAGFAVQQALEILDAIFFCRLSPLNKRRWIALVSVALGGIFAGAGEIRILKALGVAVNVDFIDYAITALFISAGTEGVNSLLKFLQYKKEEQKGEAVKTKEEAGLPAPSTDQPPLVLPAPAVPAGL